jgi:ribonuclease E
MLMPSHAMVVQPYRDISPIFARNGIEAQLDRMLQPQVTLKSGGYIIINQTEALVAIDVNSGRSTKEHSIEDTALQTNLEAAEEVARQLRLRDLAGLIVIDFIDMEENRNNRAVEKRLKDHLKNDRARIQVGRISHFGLMEMSRQRIRASVLDSTMKPCPHCGGTGHVRSDSSVALLVVRAIEEFLLKDSRHHISVRTPSATAFYVLNHKRSTLVELEQRFGLTISLEPDETVGAQHYAISRGAVVEKPVTPLPVLPATSYIEPEEVEDDIVIEEEEVEETETDEQPVHAEKAEDGEHRDRKRRKRRRRRGGKDRDREHAAHADDASVSEAAADDEDEADEHVEADADAAGTTAESDEADRKKRRRGKRGGRRNRKEDGETGSTDETASADAADGEQADASDAVAVVSEDVVAEPMADESVVVEGAAAEEAPAEKPKKAPRRSPRSKKAAAEEAEVVTEPAATEVTEAPAEEKPAKKPRAPRRKAAEPAQAPEAIEVASEAPAKEEAVAPANDEPAVPAEEPQPEVDDNKPKKSGWWQRKSFF